MVAVEKQIVIDEWHGLYGESWKGLICDEAFAHPAKFSRALVRRIYDHVIEEGWANKGSFVVDPFGGVALGAFDAMRHGLHWTGCELEMKFVGLGTANILQWENRFSRMPQWGTARLLQGDSRKLAEVLSAAECCVSSPPYSPAALGHKGAGNEIDKRKGLHARCSDNQYGESEGQLSQMKEGDHAIAITSPPFLEGRSSDRTQSRVVEDKRVGGATEHRKTAYGDVDGQLGAMPEGQLCVTSPPFESSTQVNNTPGDITAGRARWEGGRDSAARVKQDYADYSSEGNLGNMRGGFEAAISSPPYEGYDEHGGRATAAERDRRRLERLRPDLIGRFDTCFKGSEEYGNAAGQLGNERGETFWSASRLILEQLHQVIIPGGHAVFVVKAFVRDKKIVDFPAQWAQLCEAVGFRLLHHHHALLVEHSGTQGGFEEDREIRVERKSFFRRLAEKKGSPRIDHESVLCFERAI